MSTFMIGFAFCASIVSLVLSWRAHKRTKEAFAIINNRGTRTVTVNMQDGNITVIKEFKKDDVVDVK